VDVVDDTGDDDEGAVIGGTDSGLAAAAISQLSVHHRRFLLPD